MKNRFILFVFITIHSIVLANQAPTISWNTSASKYVDLGSGKISCVMHDISDPFIVNGINVTVNDEDLNSLTFSISSSNTAVLPVSNYSIIGSGTVRVFKINPIGVGFTTINLIVKDNQGVTSKVTLDVAVSDALKTASLLDVYSTGECNGSTGIPIDENYILIGDDEINKIRLYDRKHSGLPIYDFDFSTLLNLTGLEVDVEASYRSTTNPNRIFWMGSQSNSKTGKPRPDRDRIFATEIVGTGVNTTLKLTGYYDNLRSKIIAWGDSYGYNLTAKSASGIIPKRIDGYNIEGMEMGPDGTTLYICFRAPYVGPGTNKALICPLLNFETWFGSGNPTIAPTFGTPIEIDLNNHGIRSLSKNKNNVYIIVAGSYDSGTFELYSWNGNPNSTPKLLNADLTNLSIEGIVSVPDDISVPFSIDLISDLGTFIPYQDAVENKDITTLQFQKFLTSTIAVTPKNLENIDFQLNKKNDVIGYPNPVVSDFIMEFQNDTPIPNDFLLYTIEGKCILDFISTRIEQNKVFFNLNNIPAGVYFITSRSKGICFRFLKL